MIALCVDDELLPLEALVRAVRKSPDIENVVFFDDEYDALEWAKNHPVDIAFLDIELHEMNGIELARRLVEYHPDLSVIFCTGYDQYALNVLSLHMDAGYLLKPFRSSQVQKEISHVKSKHPSGKSQLLSKDSENSQTVSIRLMGEFSITCGGKEITLLSSKMRKATSFLEYLILNYGVQIPKQRLINLFWSNYLYSNPDSAIKALVSRLRKTLSEIRPDLENCIVSDTGSYSFQVQPDMEIDVLTLRRLFSEMETEEKSFRQEELFRQIQQLYTGDLYFPGDFIGGETFVTDLHTQYLSAVRRYTGRLMADRKYQQVLEICRSVSMIDPFDEGLHMRIMEAQNALGHPEEAVKEYEKLRSLHRKHLNTEPSTEIREYYEALREASFSAKPNLPEESDRK